MLKKLLCCIILCGCCFINACTMSKKDLIRENTTLMEENTQLSDRNDTYEDVKSLFDFYNKLSTETVNSFVLIESKHTFTTQTSYSDGVIVASNGYDYYVLTDYNSLIVGRNVAYRIMNANAEVYNAQLVSSNGNAVYDNQTGLVLLKARVNSSSMSKMKNMRLSDISDTLATISNIEQLNKIQIEQSKNITTSTYVYEDKEFKTYVLNGYNTGSLVSDDNMLCGFYFDGIQGYASSELIKKVAYATYSLIL